MPMLAGEPRTCGDWIFSGHAATMLWANLLVIGKWHLAVGWQGKGAGWGRGKGWTGEKELVAVQNEHGSNMAILNVYNLFMNWGMGYTAFFGVHGVEEWISSTQ
jgi:hypothetical protein